MIYPIYQGISSDQAVVKAYPRLASYSDADLGLITSYLESASVPGAMTWVQDLRADNAAHMVRGYNDSDKPHQLTAGWGNCLRGNTKLRRLETHYRGGLIDPIEPTGNRCGLYAVYKPLQDVLMSFPTYHPDCIDKRPQSALKTFQMYII